MVYGADHSNYVTHKFTFRPTKITTAPSAYRPYMVVLYKTNADVVGTTAPQLRFSGWNSSEGYVVLEDDVSVSGGNWVYTRPVHVENEVQNYAGSGNTVFSRFNSTTHVQLMMTYGSESVSVPADTTFLLKRSLSSLQKQKRTLTSKLTQLLPLSASTSTVCPMLLTSATPLLLM